MKKKKNCITVFEVRAGKPKETIEEGQASQKKPSRKSKMNSIKH